jgi:hypothetical protein
MKDEDIQFGKYYELDKEQTYFSIDLQRNVKFNDTLVVKPTHRSNDMCGTFKGGGCLWFGTLVNVGITGFHDYDTNNEIEFVSQDVVSEYKFKETLPLDFIMPMLV